MDNLSNIFARNCSVRRIDRPAAAAFLDSSHRLGSAYCRYCYGLFVERTTGAAESRVPRGTLVAVSAFSGARRWQKGDRRISSYEWVRYASLPGIRVVGGMGKTLSAFIEEYHPDDVMSYADAGSPDGGDAYRVLGFREEGIVSGEGFRSIKFRLVPTSR